MTIRESFDRKRRTSVLLRLGSVGLGLAVFVGVFLVPRMRERSELARQLEEANQLLEDFRGMEAAVDASEGSRDLRNEARSRVERSIPNGHTGLAAKASIERMARDAAVALGEFQARPERSIATSESATPVACIAIPFELRGSGTFEEVHRFVRSLESASPLVRIGSLDLQRTNEGAFGAVSFRMELETFGFRPGAGA